MDQINHRRAAEHPNPHWLPGRKLSTCALDCPDACSLSVRVEDDGRASKLEGDRDHPITQGFLCGKEED